MVKTEKKGGTANNANIKKVKNTIVKTFTKRAYNNFLTELTVYLLANSKKVPFIPKLQAFSFKKRELTIEYVGPSLKEKYRGKPKELKKYNNQIKKLYKKMFKILKVHHNDIRYKNVCVQNGKLYLIDFEYTGRDYKDKNQDKIL